MDFFSILWAFIVESAPFLLLGLFISGFIHEWIPMDKIKKWLGAKSIGSVFKASLIGVPLPLCSCSVIPTAVTLRKNGASNGATSSFLISTPESGVDSISITYALMDLPMTVFRPLAAFASAFVAGVFQMKFNEFEYIEEGTREAKKDQCCSGVGSVKNNKKRLSLNVKKAFQFSFGKLSDDIAGWLTIGIILGALIQFIVPSDFFQGTGMIQNRLLILAVGIPFYICASASTPIAVSLMLKGLSPGSALLFLLVGPATNISNIAVLQKYIGKKGVVINILAIALVGLFFSFLVDYLYLHFLTIKLSEGLSSHGHHGMFEQVCGAFLVFLLIKGIYKEQVKPKFFNKQASCH
ncbi:MAG: hypothetical protein CME62_00195 [Halobacteriovoraceae bacterium]|nr:hypothetical protein [Halobacteriovoraceae bacterium]